MEKRETMDDRYRRQIALDGIGDSGQEKLNKAKILIVGLGGLGNPVAYYLAAAGVGNLTLLDNDTIAPNNLNRQILFTPEDVDGDKALAAKAKLEQFNRELNIDIKRQMVTKDNAKELTNGYDLVMSCVDNLEARRSINYGCVQNNIPMIDGGIQNFSGYILPIIPIVTACYQCVLGDLADKPVPKPVLGSTVGTVGLLMTTEAIKYICGIESGLIGKMLICDFKTVSLKKVNIKRRSDCPICSKQ